MNKKKYMHLSLLMISLFTYISMFSYKIYQKRTFENKLIQIRNENKNKEKRLISLEKSINSNKEELEKIQELNKLLIEIDKNSYLLKNINNFVIDFEKILKKYSGLEKISYEVRQQDNKLSININFNEEYKELRKFIYDLEKEFYFLEINYLRMEKTDSLIRGNMNIQIYFRGEKDE